MRNARKAEAEGSESGGGEERKEFTLYRTSVTAVAFIVLTFSILLYPFLSSCRLPSTFPNTLH